MLGKKAKTDVLLCRTYTNPELICIC